MVSGHSPNMACRALRIGRREVRGRSPMVGRREPRKPRSVMPAFPRWAPRRHQSFFSQGHFLRLLFILLDFLSFPRAPTGLLIVSIALRAGTAAGPAVAIDL